MNQMGLQLSDKYEVINFNEEVAIGDLVVKFQLKISDKDYRRIIGTIKQTKNYGEYKNGEYPNSFTSYNGEYKFIGYKQENNYIYRKESNSNVIDYNLVLKEDNMLYFTYAED